VLTVFARISNAIKCLDQAVYGISIFGNLGWIIWLGIRFAGGNLHQLDPEFHSMVQLIIYVCYLCPISLVLGVVRRITGGKNKEAVLAVGFGTIGTLGLVVISYL
jgi:hypothetical protein